jgi:ACS family hexuronate transporter-like MFS transporter
MVLYAFGALPLAFVLYAAPIYFAKALGQTQQWLGHWLWLPPLGWELGYFFWGALTDRGLPTARAVIILGAASLPLALTSLLSSPGWVLAAMVAAMFVAAGFVIVALSLAMRTFSTGHAGFIAGLGAGSWSALVALCMPLFGRLFDHRDYAQAFTIAALFPPVGVLAWWSLFRRRYQ